LNFQGLSNKGALQASTSSYPSALTAIKSVF